MNKLKQTSLDQTGVAIFSLSDKKEKIIPLFSLNPMAEAENMLKMFPSGTELAHVFLANNMLTYKIGDAIDAFTKEHNYLPEDLMDELVSGFPFIEGYATNFSNSYYA